MNTTYVEKLDNFFGILYVWWRGHGPTGGVLWEISELGGHSHISCLKTEFSKWLNMLQGGREKITQKTKSGREKVETETLFYQKSKSFVYVKE